MSRSQGRKVLPWALIALVVVSIFVVRSLLQGVEIDSLTSCPKDGPVSVTAVIVDASDPLAPHQVVAFEKFADSLIRPPKEDEEAVPINSDKSNYVKKGHLLVAYEIADEAWQPRRLFGQCNPGDPASRDVRDQLTQGEIWAKSRWLKFTQELKNSFPKEGFQRTSPTSPIIETIRYVRRAEFPSSSELKESGRKAGVIFIVSDMLQNSDRLSHFEDELPTASDMPSAFALDLTGIDIGVRYLKHDQYVRWQQGARPHFTWWRKFFAAAGSPLNRPPEEW